MASGSIVGGGDGSRESRRWPENGKVYTRKASKLSKPALNPSQQTLDTVTTATGDRTVPQPDHHQSLALTDFADDAFSEPEAANPIPDTERKEEEDREHYRKLVFELDQVRALIKRIETRELQLAAVPAPVLRHSLSQLSVMPSKRAPANSEAASAPPHVQLSISVPAGLAAESSIEKRTPKANRLYQNSEFILANDRLPTMDSHKKQKLNGVKKHEYGSQAIEKKLYGHAFKSCGNLLAKLMKHKFGWVFNAPVDVKGLGLHDYYSIIHHPMDLGTVKSRLGKNWYKNPEEFADDVRLTFHNAMTYNPKGQDVHIMAEQLAQIFEENWSAIELELTHIHTTVTKKIHHVDTRTIERSDSTPYPVATGGKVNMRNLVHHASRPPALKKPKAKDLNKREMTFEEKQKLSNNLQNLPPEKLDTIVAIIRKKNMSMNQHEDEIEIDMDRIDTETLWELDRLVTNYKKSLSKYKRRAELALLKKAEAEQNMQGAMKTHDIAMEVPIESREVAQENDAVSSIPIGGENKEDAASRSSSSSSSSSDSGSSSDSDSESSSTYESDAARSPRKLEHE